MIVELYLAVLSVYDWVKLNRIWRGIPNSWRGYGRAAISLLASLIFVTGWLETDLDKVDKISVIADYPLDTHKK